MKKILNTTKETLIEIGRQCLVIPEEGKKCEKECKIARGFAILNLILLAIILTTEVIHNL